MNLTATKTNENHSPFRDGAKAPSQSFCGSSTQISDRYANIIHHIEYMPYGENFFEMRDYWGTDYKFNAKELDNETGMYYYGARYYTPELSVWLSVDPLSDKYPSMTPYNYCSNNPMKFIDPDGRDNVIFLVNLQKDNKVDVNSLINKTNKQFEKLGLNTRMVLAPDGSDFNPGYMDDTDSYVALGSVNDVKDFIKSNDASIYNEFFKDWLGGNNTEKASNRIGQKTNAIGIDANALPDVARTFGTTTENMGAFLVLHGAVHNANLNHSDENALSWRSGQTAFNSAIMFSGNTVRSWGLNYCLSKDNNSGYINAINNFFGGRPASNNYNYNKRNAHRKVIHY